MIDVKLILFISWLFSLTTLENSEALPLTMNRTDNVYQEIHPTMTVGKPSNSRMKMRLFPMNIPMFRPKAQPVASLHVSPKFTTKQIQLFAEPQDANTVAGAGGAESEAGGAGGAASEAGAAGGVAFKADEAASKAGAADGVASEAGKTAVNASATNALPGVSKRKNKQGSWVKVLSFGTTGNGWRDTRLHNRKDNPPSRGKIDPKVLKRYYPNGPLTKVCGGKSTVYNVPVVIRWLRRNVYNHIFYYRPIYTDLREELYIQGDSESCHTKDQTDFLEFFECSVRRHQRMEYMIPMYPLHQRGYRGFYTKL